MYEFPALRTVYCFIGLVGMISVFAISLIGRIRHKIRCEIKKKPIKQKTKQNQVTASHSILDNIFFIASILINGRIHFVRKYRPFVSVSEKYKENKGKEMITYLLFNLSIHTWIYMSVAKRWKYVFHKQ